MGTTLIVLRHLRTSDGLEGRFCSKERDISILPNQVISSEVVEKIRRLEKNYALAHTGLKRSRETATLLARVMRFLGEMLVFPEFQERQGGKLAGLRFEEIQQLFPQLQEPRELWNVESPISGLESVADFLSRIERGLVRIRDIDLPVVLVAHAGSIKGIQAILGADEFQTRKQILCIQTPEHGECFKFQL